MTLTAQTIEQAFEELRRNEAVRIVIKDLRVAMSGCPDKGNFCDYCKIRKQTIEALEATLKPDTAPT